MSQDQDEQTNAEPVPFDFSAFPEDTLFHERREGRERRFKAGPKPAPAPGAPERRAPKKERRRRIDPTTFEKQYTDDEMEFMNAMQRFKVQSGKSFPSHGEVLQVAFGLGYRKLVAVEDDLDDTLDDSDDAIAGIVFDDDDEPTVED